MTQAVRFKDPFHNYDPATIFRIDQNTKTLSPFSSGEAFTGAGFQFGQEQIGDPNVFAGFKIGAPIGGLDAVKSELNQFQNDTFAKEGQPAKRQSSTLTERIKATQSAFDVDLEHYRELSKKLLAMESPNYMQEYMKLREQQGISALEQDLLGTRSTRRELPFAERAASGNAAVMTEGQLGANVQQKDIPLEIREANLIDRLKLAADFVNTAMSLKEKDANTARQAITDAINLVGNTINLSRSLLGDLRGEQDRQESKQLRALEFALNHGVETPAFLVGNQAYDARTLEPLSLEAYQQLTGQRVGLPEAQTDFGPNFLTSISRNKEQERGLVLDLMKKYLDAGISQNDTFETAVNKVQNSPSYRLEMANTRSLIANRGPGPSGSSIKLTTNDRQRLAAVGFNSNEISQIERDLNQYGLDAVIDGMNSNQAQAVRNVLAGVTPTQEGKQGQLLSPNYFRQVFSHSQLEARAKEANFTSKGGGLLGTGLFASNKGDVDSYINYLMGLVDMYRAAGYNDQDILKLLPLPK